uniref:LysR substrate-binding domain-containing protein n=1 Tax=Pseudomonas sp. RW407 TaxID=2202894 RepID=UPI001314F93D|nr:LysR substrate-binding domain-containing protein [Pseudomonas sp. RW407]
MLEPHLGEFLARYPGLRLELVLNDGFTNIIADGADVGIRLGESLDEHMVVVLITPRIEMAIMGSPAPWHPPDDCGAWRIASRAAGRWIAGPSPHWRRSLYPGVRSAWQRRVQRRREHAQGSYTGLGVGQVPGRLHSRTTGIWGVGARASALVPVLCGFLSVCPTRPPWRTCAIRRADPGPNALMEEAA